MKKNYFITLEGIEGTGKSSAMQFIHAQLEHAGISLVMTREPGGTEVSDSIRQVLLSHYQEKMASDTELLLMFASRAQNLATVIKPALASGKWVLCDRFTDASYAYQGGGRGIELNKIAILENWVQGHLQPDITFLFDAPVEIGLARIKARKFKDRIENEQVDFFKRVRESYLERAARYPARFRIIDASVSLHLVQQQISVVLKELL